VRAYSKTMKTIWLLLVLGMSVVTANAQVAEKKLKLIGVSSGSGKEVAMIEVRIPSRAPEDMVLSAGQGQNGVQVVKIDMAKGTVDLNVDGEARGLVLEEDSEHPSTNTIDRASAPSIDFRSIPLDLAISLYADYKNRTVMQHPQLGKSTFSLKASPRSKEEAAAIFEKMFSEQKIATILDGEHFVMVVPFAFTNAVKPRATAVAQTNSIVPERSVVFRTAPIEIALQTYADFVHKDIVNLHEGYRISCCPTFTFIQTTPLSRDELCYALETQIEWRDIRVVPDGNGKFKLERIPKSN
jgi:hypothetical protein